MRFVSLFHEIENLFVYENAFVHSDKGLTLETSLLLLNLSRVANSEVNNLPFFHSFDICFKSFQLTIHSKL